MQELDNPGYKRVEGDNLETIMDNFFFFLFFLILRRMGKSKALAHHTSTYFHTRRVSI